MKDLDFIDRKILRSVQKNGRISNANLADAYLVDANIAKSITKGANLENTILE